MGTSMLFPRCEVSISPAIRTASGFSRRIASSSALFSELLVVQIGQEDDPERLSDPGVRKGMMHDNEPVGIKQNDPYTDNRQNAQNRNQNIQHAVPPLPAQAAGVFSEIPD